jgi:glyoxylase-like metal-dependent hydrolase (beta-lactamase superfamily II)
MLKKILLVNCSVLLLLLTSSKKHVSNDYRLLEMSPGIWAAIHDDASGEAICNAGIIDLGDKTVVVDAFISPYAAMNLKKDAERLTGRQVTYLVNTHYHNDHTRGNQIFSSPTKIISSRITQNLFLKNDTASLSQEKKYVPKSLEDAEKRMRNASAENIDEEKSWYNYYKALNRSLNMINSTPPEVVFNDTYQIKGKTRTVILKEFKNGHSASDVVVMLPKDGVVFMGDLLFNQRHPFLAEGNPDSLLHHLEYFKSCSELKKFIPGHGPVAQPADLDSMQLYIRFIQNTAAGAIKNKVSDAEIFQQPLPAPYNSWLLKGFFRPNYLSVKESLK